MNGSALIAEVRTSTLVPTSQVSDDALLVWLNEGYLRVAAMFNWPWLEGVGKITTAAGTQAYSLTTAITDFDTPPVVQPASRIVAIYDDILNVRLEQWSPSTAVATYGDVWPTAAHATGFFLWAGSLNLIPIPTAIVVYKVLLHKAPTALTAGSGPEFDPMFHHCLAHYGEFRMWQREEDLDKAAAAYSHFADMVERMRLWYTQRVEDAPWAVGVPGMRMGRRSNTPFLDGL